ncbi:DpnI domain-containing protein [Mesorhizobium sp. VK25A]|uniref:DpnI domain-containing protein n=1 Tax=Mesorhizobium vachelliae TaxID=3072309 RepID=A0ABU5AB13_9HYPH|nr:MULTISPECIES: DpnI domain-containing protein [unclassified Mesorhizobium]MDX8534903.1 DpnI domain-containing protein [Mesorhizobium sp. VK25D]MDX8547545.1 DpnI domain-containing protein [Mesorhizobium sp. VK25A]
MKFGFEEAQAKYVSGSQRARVWTEQWVSQWLYCPNCAGLRLTQFSANQPVADFFCGHCSDQFELKGQKKAFGAKVADGAYFTKIDRLASSTNPNLILLNYDLNKMAVLNVCMVPKHFFVPDIIEKRKPLAQTARRAGWIGSNILLSRIPNSGRIYIVRNSIPIPKESVIEQWQRTLFLREKGAEARGWLVEVMKCVDLIGPVEFNIEQVYAFEGRLSALYPHNRNVRPKIRQQLQILRDNGYLDFVSRGRYRIRSNPL